MSSVLYEAQPKQYYFHTSTADETLYGGAAGGGKSYAIIWDAVNFCLKVENAHVAIFRRTFPELEKSIILEFLSKVPNYLYQYNKKEHRVYFNNGSIIDFSHCEHDQDVYNYQSAQYDRIYFDELTHFSYFIYSYLHSRCRTTKQGVKPQIKAATNPGNIGHHWVKKRFIDNAEPMKITERIDEESGAKYTTLFIPARVYDNKYIMEADPAYVERLKKLPEDQRKALLDGNWEMFEGQFFKEWNYDVHTCEPFEIPQWWNRFRSIDWGYTRPTAVLWYAVAPNGTIYVYRELVQAQMTDIELARQIISLSKGENISYTVADPALWSITQYERGESIAMRLTWLGVPLIKGDNNRIAGWNVIRSYLAYDEKNKPKLQIFRNCVNLIRALPGLVHDTKNPEDVNTDGDDDAPDSLRYGLMTRPHKTTIPKKNEPPDTFNAVFKKIQESKSLQGYVGSL